MSQREILFKAKRTDNGEWVEGYYVAHRNCCHFIIQAPFGGYIANDNTFYAPTAYMVDKNTVCQYTGLTDKNGKKIFEGDILKYKDDYTKETKCEVQFHRFGFMAVWPNDWDAESLDNGFHVYSEAIGNIHDN